MVHALCVQEEEVRLWEILENPPALTMRLLVKSELFISLTQHLFSAYSVPCAILGQLQKKQKCVRPGPCFQGTCNLAGELEGVCRQPYVLQGKNYSGSKEGH